MRKATNPTHLLKGIKRKKEKGKKRNNQFYCVRSFPNCSYNTLKLSICQVFFIDFL